MVKRRERRLGGCERRILLGIKVRNEGSAERLRWFIETLVLLSATGTSFSATIVTATIVMATIATATTIRQSVY